MPTPQRKGTTAKQTARRTPRMEKTSVVADCVDVKRGELLKSCGSSVNFLCTHGQAKLFSRESRTMRAQSSHARRVDAVFVPRFACSSRIRAQECTAHQPAKDAQQP